MSNEYESFVNREIVTTRVIRAPRELVWRIWTDPEHLRNWWGPRGFTNTFHEFDLRPGGAWRFIMHGPDGADYQNESVFVEVTRPERLVFDHISPPHFRATVLFDDLNGRTKITFRQLFELPEDYRRVKVFAVPANEEFMDKLEAELTGVLAAR